MSPYERLASGCAFVALLATTGFVRGAAPQPAAAPKPAAPVFDWKGPSVTGNVVSSVAYPAKDGTRRRMLLVRKEFPDDWDRANPFNDKYREYDPRGNILLAMYDAKEATLDGATIVWHALVHHDRTLTIKEHVCPALVYHRDRKVAFVVVVHSASVRADTRIWTVPLEGAAQKLPDVFDSANDKHWMTGARPTFKHESRTEDEHVCGFESIQVLPQKTGLLIFGRREHANCPDYVLRHDFATGKLFHVRLNDEDPDGEREKQRAEDEKALKAEEEEAMRKKAATPKTGVPK